MFTEDPLWDTGVHDPFEEKLHQKLFGTIHPEQDNALLGDQEKKQKNNEGDKDLSSCSAGPRKKKRTNQSLGEIEIIPKKRKSANKVPQVVTTKKSQKDQAVIRPQADSIRNEQSQNERHLPGTRGKPNGGSVSVQKTPPSIHNGSSSKLYAKMYSQLEGSRFRMINQKLYTSTGEDAKLMFEEDPTLFEVYHRGFNTQVSKWPINPVDRIITHVRTLPHDVVVCDFGCGEAKLAQNVPQRVHSFDLVAINEHVTACDMAHVPLKRHRVDLCIFCLSLMGSNIAHFIKEARRVVKKGGEVRICEVSSRFSSVGDFICDVETFGFKLLTMTEFSKMFVEFVFTAVERDKDNANVPEILLKPCIYKRR